MRALMRTHAALLCVGVLTFILMGAGQSLYGPALPVYARAYDIGLGTAGLLVSAHWIGCAFGVGAMFVWGRFVTPRVVVVLMALGAALWPLARVGAWRCWAGWCLAQVTVLRRWCLIRGCCGPLGRAGLRWLAC